MTGPLLTPFSRRRFVQGIAAAGALTALPFPLRHALAAASPPLLSGSTFALEIGPVPMNVTGRPRMGVGINGQVPAPILKWREGDTVTLAVTNRLDEPTSIHWHGIRTPSPMDGVPGLSFAGIAPGETFTYRFPVHQSGTYWYHSHSGFQEQSGLYGPLVIEPRAGYAQPFDRDYVVMLSDWSDENPETIVSNLKMQSDYYNYGQRTAGTFFADISKKGLAETISDRLEWGKMRMSPTDILDVTGATYTYLVNGQSPAANWTALFRPGERVRLRFINGSSMSIFDVRIPGLKLVVVQADGNDVEPVTVDEFRIGTAETYDVIVQPNADQAFTIFAQAQDRSGFARATLAPRPGMAGIVPPLDPRPLRTMADMGMAGMGHGNMAGMDMGQKSQPPMNMPGMDHSAMSGMSDMDHMAMPGMEHGSMGGMAMPEKDTGMAMGGKTNAIKRGVEVDNVAMMPEDRLNEAGDGLDNNGRRVLLYTDLRALKPGDDKRPPSREIVLHLSGNMQRFIWGFDGKKFSEAEPIRLARNERVRFVLINDTMMDHPIHLHGLWSELENGESDYRPYKHTILVKPGERLSYLVTADEPGRWAYHCHLLYHMEMGMFREVRVA
jgi:CopA family copper-resistance protein